jgi:hypothetical protein
MELKQKRPLTLMGLNANSLKHLSRKYHYENLVFLYYTFRRVRKVIQGYY